MVAAEGLALLLQLSRDHGSDGLDGVAAAHELVEERVDLNGIAIIAATITNVRARARPHTDTRAHARAHARTHTRAHEGHAQPTHAQRTSLFSWMVVSPAEACRCLSPRTCMGGETRDKGQGTRDKSSAQRREQRWASRWGLKQRTPQLPPCVEARASKTTLCWNTAGKELTLRGGALLGNRGRPAGYNY